jgi:hypothetical protein
MVGLMKMQMREGDVIRMEVEVVMMMVGGHCLSPSGASPSGSRQKCPLGKGHEGMGRWKRQHRYMVGLQSYVQKMVETEAKKQSH